VGFEYKIAFRTSDPADTQAFLDRLCDSMSATLGRDFTVTLEADGFYFCDYTKSEQSSCAFRKLVDEALQHSEVVIHEL
jgi:hypothetical protein